MFLRGLSKLRFLQFGFPLIQDGAFNRAYGETSSAVDAGAVIDVCVFCTFGVGLAFCPVDALYWTNRDTIGNTLAKISNDGIRHDDSFDSDSVQAVLLNHDHLRRSSNQVILLVILNECIDILDENLSAVNPLI
jgi:hypothetical protein